MAYGDFLGARTQREAQERGDLRTRPTVVGAVTVTKLPRASVPSTCAAGPPSREELVTVNVDPASIWVVAFTRVPESVISPVPADVR